jgi:signal transduction histidine kinase
VRDVRAFGGQNALDAMPQGARSPWPTSRRRTQVQLHVQDTGSGIAAEQLGQIFETLHTTKPGWTGLSLHIVQEIMTAYGEWIALQSAAGQEITFTLTFPCLYGNHQADCAGLPGDH